MDRATGTRAIARDSPRGMDTTEEDEVAADPTEEGKEEGVEETKLRQSSRPSLIDNDVKCKLSRAVQKKIEAKLLNLI